MTASERRAIIVALLNEFDEDYVTIGRIIKAAKAATGATGWDADLDSRAKAHQPFIERGLSIPWWIAEVIRRSV